MQNPCDLHNSKTINTIDMQSAIYIIQCCFSQSNYNFCYIPVHMQSFLAKLFWHKGGRGVEVILHPIVPHPAIVQSTYNRRIQIQSYNPNTIDIIQIQSTQSKCNLPNPFWHTFGTKGGVKVILYQLCQIPQSYNPYTI